MCQPTNTDNTIGETGENGSAEVLMMQKKRHVITYEKGVNWDANDLRQTEGPAVMAHCGRHTPRRNTCC